MNKKNILYILAALMLASCSIKNDKDADATEIKEYVTVYGQASDAEVEFNIYYNFSCSDVATAITTPVEIILKNVNFFGEKISEIKCSKKENFEIILTDSTCASANIAKTESFYECQADNQNYSIKVVFDLPYNHTIGNNFLFNDGIFKGIITVNKLGDKFGLLELFFN